MAARGACTGGAVVAGPPGWSSARMNDVTRDPAYDRARGEAMTLPTFVLRYWERRAARRAGRRSPPSAEVARLLAVRAVLRQREDR